VKNSARWQVPVIGLFLLFMVIPILATVMFSVSVRWDRTIWPEGFTLSWWEKVTSRPAFERSLSNSLFVASVTVAGSAFLVVPTAYLAHLRVAAARPWIELAAIIPFGLPGVVLALGLIRFYSPLPLPLINTPTILVASYVVLTLPFMYRSVINALEAIDAKALAEAAQSLGAGSLRTLALVIVPNILPGIVNGSLLVFSTVLAEFTLANLLIGTRFKTFPIYLVEFTRFDARQASALAVISFLFAWVLSLAVLWIAARGGRPRVVIGTR